MSQGIFTNPFTSDENQARGFALLLILSIICLTFDIMVVGMRCDEIFMTGDDCAVGIGYLGITALYIAFGNRMAPGHELNNNGV